MLRELPRVTASYTETIGLITFRIPLRPKIDKPLPILVNCLRLTELPRFTMSITDILEPSRAQLLMEKDEPTVK
jgi:hypothetical protein